MPCLTLPFDPVLGPIVILGVSPPTSAAGEQSPPKIEWLKALIDTGCSQMSLSPAIAQRASLPVIGKAPVASTTQQIDVAVYLADLYLPFADPMDRYHHAFRDIRFIEFKLGSPHFDILIGRDLLSLGLFQLNGKTSQLTFAW